jgi:zinc finger MYND domain-containing protein 10
MNKAKYLNDVLTNFEAEEIISRKLLDLPIDKIGSEEFIRHHTLLERLNMQAVKNALLGGDDFILENFVTYEKMKSLITELFTINHFKSYIYPKIKSKIPESASCKMYICLYHEAVVVNLLENFMFHVTACQTSEDYIIDIIEYCYTKISKAMNNKQSEITNKSSEKKSDSLSNEQEMDNKFEEIEFYISMACLSILRYITDHLQALPFPVKNHIMNIKDIPMLLVALMESKPWLKNDDKGGLLLFENNQWSPISEYSNKLPKLEAQIWISIFNLMMNVENNQKYEITEFRKSNLLRLRKFMNESLYDHIPPLQQFYRALEEMALMTHSATPLSNPFVVEMIPMLFNKKYSNEEIEIISNKILNDYFPKNYNHQTFKREMDMISEIYNMNNIEYFMEDPKCANCGKDATSRCSKCKSEWYCGRDCQIKRWKLHKEMCTKLAEVNQHVEASEKGEVLIQPSKEVKIIEKTVQAPEINKNSQKSEKLIQEVKKEFDELD